MNYQKFLEENPDAIVINGHLVDFMGTLLLGYELNETLYAAMEEAYARGEKVYIYSSFCTPRQLADIGIDSNKYPIVSKMMFTEIQTFVVLGKVIDDEKPHYHGLILSSPENWLHPSEKTFDLKCSPLPDGLKNKIFSR